MSYQVSPFAKLTGADQQIHWLEYQSLRLPYVQTATSSASESETELTQTDDAKQTDASGARSKELQMQRVFSQTTHRQYDAVIARMKQAQLQATRYSTL